jgi:replicative DNA helicase
MATTFRHISAATTQATEYIKARKEGELPSARTGYTKLDDALLDGIPWGNIVSICGSSSAGKSSILEQIKYNILDSDPDAIALSFEMEMSSTSQVMRAICRNTGIGIKALKSARGYAISEEEEELVQKELISISKKNVFTIDHSVTVSQAEKLIYDFIIENDIQELKKKLLITADYAGLFDQATGEDDRIMLNNLYKMLIRVKNNLALQNIPIIILPLLQSNRNAFSPERMKNPAMQYPTQADISGSSFPFNSSDIVIFSSNPSKLNGIGDSYGPYNMPVKHFLTGAPYVYLHVLKSREGLCPTIDMLSDFARFRLLDMN